MYTGSLPANRESYHSGDWLSAFRVLAASGCRLPLVAFATSPDGRSRLSPPPGQRAKHQGQAEANSRKPEADSPLRGERQTEDLAQFAQRALSVADIILFGSLQDARPDLLQDLDRDRCVEVIVKGVEKSIPQVANGELLLDAIRRELRRFDQVIGDARPAFELGVLEDPRAAVMVRKEVQAHGVG